MLDGDCWGPNEPRLNFPIFGDSENSIEFTIQEDNNFTLRRLLAPIYHVLKTPKKLFTLFSLYKSMFFPKRYKFRGVFLNRKGEQLHKGIFEGAYRPGDYVSWNINDWLKNNNIKIQDGNFIFIASRGLPDKWHSSPGTVTLRVDNHGRLSGYCTGYFARALNDGKKHFGYTGINPLIEAKGKWNYGIILINHSSEPSYNKIVTPLIRLYRNDTEYLETSFGNISPHASLERNILDLFPSAPKFLTPNRGIGHTVTTLKGTSLASLHILRSEDNHIAALEHSRPSHANIISF